MFQQSRYLNVALSADIQMWQYLNVETEVTVLQNMVKLFAFDK